MNTKTLKYIANKLNVSVSTVSRVVNKKEYVNEDTRARVLRALEEYNYVPNQVARSLKSNATKTIGVILPDVCEVFFGHILKGIGEVVAKKGYSIIVADSNESAKTEEQYLDLFFQKRVDALVLATVERGGTKCLEYFENGIPVVFIDNLPELSVPIDSVMIDNVYASRLAVKHLIENGHRDIAIIVGSIKETTGFDRLLGYRLTLEETGAEVNQSLVRYGNYKEDDGYKCMQSLLDSRDSHPFSAVYVTSEMMTFGAIKAIRERHLSIPDDISLVGFDFHDKTGLVFPSITTVRQPEHQIGVNTGELLIKRLEGKAGGLSAENTQRILLQPYIEVKQSVKRI